MRLEQTSEAVSTDGWVPHRIRERVSVCGTGNWKGLATVGVELVTKGATSVPHNQRWWWHGMGHARPAGRSSRRGWGFWAGGSEPPSPPARESGGVLQATPAASGTEAWCKLIFYAVFVLEIVACCDNSHFPGSKIFRLYFKMWWWQSPPQSKVCDMSMTSPPSHSVRSCAYACELGWWRCIVPPVHQSMRYILTRYKFSAIRRLIRTTFDWSKNAILRIQCAFDAALRWSYWIFIKNFGIGKLECLCDLVALIRPTWRYFSRHSIGVWQTVRRTERWTPGYSIHRASMPPRGKNLIPTTQRDVVSTV